MCWVLGGAGGSARPQVNIQITKNSSNQRCVKFFSRHRESRSRKKTKEKKTTKNQRATYLVCCKYLPILFKNLYPLKVRYVAKNGENVLCYSPAKMTFLFYCFYVLDVDFLTLQNRKCTVECLAIINLFYPKLHTTSGTMWKLAIKEQIGQIWLLRYMYYALSFSEYR